MRLPLNGITILFLLFLVSSGCRTYGGYGTEEGTIEQILRANEEFADELERARNLLPVLEQQVPEVGSGVTFREKYEALLTAHATLLEENMQLAEEVVDNGAGYRKLNEIFGSILSEQRIIRNRYNELLYDVFPEYEVAEVVPGGVLPEALYVVAPPFYKRLAYAGQPWPMSSPQREDVAPGSIE